MKQSETVPKIQAILSAKVAKFTPIDIKVELRDFEHKLERKERLYTFNIILTKITLQFKSHYGTYRLTLLPAILCSQVWPF